jgi:hypothetical protein
MCVAGSLPGKVESRNRDVTYCIASLDNSFSAYELGLSTLDIPHRARITCWCGMATLSLCATPAIWINVTLGV